MFDISIHTNVLVLFSLGLFCEADEGFRDGDAMDVNLPAHEPPAGASTNRSFQSPALRIFCYLPGVDRRV